MTITCVFLGLFDIILYYGFSTVCNVQVFFFFRLLFLACEKRRKNLLHLFDEIFAFLFIFVFVAFFFLFDKIISQLANINSMCIMIKMKQVYSHISLRPSRGRILHVLLSSTINFFSSLYRTQIQRFNSNEMFVLWMYKIRLNFNCLCTLWQ